MTSFIHYLLNVYPTSSCPRVHPTLFISRTTEQPVFRLLSREQILTVWHSEEILVYDTTYRTADENADDLNDGMMFKTPPYVMSVLFYQFDECVLSFVLLFLTAHFSSS